MNTETASFWDHLEDLRRTLIRVLLIVGIGFILSLIFHDFIIDVVTFPLRSTAHSKALHTDLVTETIYRQRLRNPSARKVSFQLEEGAGEIVHYSPQVRDKGQGLYTIGQDGYIEIEIADNPSMLFLFGPLEGITSALRLCFWTGLAMTSPIWMFFVLQFVGPGLRKRERSIVVPFFLASCLFLVIGIYFSMTVMIPLANQVLHSFNTTLGENFWGVGAYLSYTVILMLGNGIAFEGVVVIAFLVHFGLISSCAMRSKRRAVIVCIFVLSAMLTPPDILTQCLLAVPLALIYELAILYASARERLKQRKPCPA